MSPVSSPRKSIVESPWYWVYVFAAGALVALLLMGWKFGPRQAQIENKYLGHKAAAEKAAGETADERTLSTGESTIVDLTPLYMVAALVFIVGWIGVWWQLYRRRRSTSDSPLTNGGAATGP